MPVVVLWALMAMALAAVDLALSAYLALVFHAYLRPGEGCRLLRQDLMLPGDLNWHAAVGMVVIRSPKTAKTGGRVHHVVLQDPTVLRLCRWAWGPLEPHQPLVHFGVRQIEGWFRAVLPRLGLRPTAYTPAGLRAGGATFDYLSRGSTVEQLMWRGIWQTLTSLRHYVQEAAATMSVAQLPKDCQVRLHFLSRLLAAVLDALTVSTSDGGELDSFGCA